MLFALFTLFAVSFGGRRGGGHSNCQMSADRVTELVSVFTTGTETLYCRLRAEKEFPHWTDGCPDPTTTTTTTTTPAPTTSTTTPAPTTSTTTPAPTTPRPAAEVLSDDGEGGPRRLLRRGGGGGSRKARTQFQVSAGNISGFKNKGGCRDEDSFTCFDDLPADDCAYTAITTVTNGDTVTLTFTSTTSTDGTVETIELVCPFEGKIKGDDCDNPENEVIRCKRQNYSYGGDDDRKFSLMCGTVEKPWEGDYPACPSALQ